MPTSEDLYTHSLTLMNVSFILIYLCFHHGGSCSSLWGTIWSSQILNIEGLPRLCEEVATITNLSPKIKWYKNRNDAETLVFEYSSRGGGKNSREGNVTWVLIAFFLVGRLNIIFVMPSSEVTTRFSYSCCSLSAPGFPWLEDSDEELKLDTKST